MEAIVIHPDSVEQLKTVKAVLKALNVRFEKQEHSINNTNSHFLNELKEAVDEVNLIKAGKLIGRPAEELLSEL